MSSWFDAKQLQSYAKSALNEAQKTLDKALDIKEEEEQKRLQKIKEKDGALSPPQVDDDASSTSSVTSAASTASSAAALAASAASAVSQAKMWGSFTGSFFDANQVGGGSAQEDDNGDFRNIDTIQEEGGNSGVVTTSPPSSLRSFPQLPPAASSCSSSDVMVISQPPASLTTSSSSFGAVLTEEAAAQSSGASVSSSSAVMEEVEEEEEMDKTIENIEPPEPPQDGFSSSKLVVKEEDDDEQSSGVSTKKSSETNLTASEHDDLNSSMSSSHTIQDPSSTETHSLSSSRLLTTSEEREEEKAAADEGDWANDDEVNVTSLLDDAMGEQEKRSETSSSKSYEVVRNECSFPTSGQTSGDEFDTTTNTSSDIEVIASPSGGASGGNNGKGHRAVRSGYSSNGSDNGRSWNRIGHTRTGSEISAAGSEEGSLHQAEIDRLLKRITELSDIVDARETKMVEMSRNNLELQEKNTDLGSQVKEAMKINAKLTEASLSNEDMTQRLAAMEKKLQKALAEKDDLLKENKSLTRETAGRMTQHQIDELIEEKDEIIEDLRLEGEKLSKQVGKHSDIIKKLRVKEKNNEKEIKALKTELEEKKTECERSKKSLSAKDEVETRQIEAIQNLTTANSKWEEEHNKVRSDLEDATEKVGSLKTSLESAYKEIAELKRGLMEKEGEAQEMALSKEMAAKQALQEQLRELQEQTRKEKDSLYIQIDELRGALSAEERATARREEQLRRERDDLMARLEQSENRHEELSGSVSAATRPLLRQIESLQSSLNEAQASSERVERSLSERLQQATIQLAAAQERERTAAEQYMQVSGKIASLESKLSSVSKEKSGLEARFESESSRRQTLEEQASKSASLADAMRNTYAEELEELRREKEFAEAALESEKCELSSEKRKNLALADQLKDRDKRIRDIQGELDITRSSRSSPTPSLGQISMNGSVSEQYSMNPWPKPIPRQKISSDQLSDEVFDQALRATPTPTSSLYDSLRQTGTAAAVVENLTAQLKQREGEMVQLQMELGQTERARDNLGAEVTRLTLRVERMEALEEDLRNMKKAYQDTEQKYQTMLTMYGEKVEEAEELKLDLADVKEMYKTQIQELIQK